MCAYHKEWKFPQIFCIFSVFFLFTFFYHTLAFRQEFLLYESESNKSLLHRFTTAVPDISAVPSIDRVKYICFRGRWTCFNMPDYHEPDLDFDRLTARNADEENFHCLDLNDLYVLSMLKPKTLFPCNSFRFLGHGDTNVSALSLYPKIDTAGQEMLVTKVDAALPDIPAVFGEVKSIAWSGEAEWTIYEEPEFGGLAFCLNPQKEHEEFRRDDVFILNSQQRWIKKPARKFINANDSINLATIGSIRRGCDPEDFAWNSKNFWAKLKRFVYSWGLGSILERLFEAETESQASLSSLK